MIPQFKFSQKNTLAQYLFPVVQECVQGPTQMLPAIYVNLGLQEFLKNIIFQVNFSNKSGQQNSYIFLQVVAMATVKK